MVVIEISLLVSASSSVNDQILPIIANTMISAKKVSGPYGNKEKKMPGPNQIARAFILFFKTIHQMKYTGRPQT